MVRMSWLNFGLIDDRYATKVIFRLLVFQRYAAIALSQLLYNLYCLLFRKCIRSLCLLPATHVEHPALYWRRAVRVWHIGIV